MITAPPWALDHAAPMPSADVEPYAAVGLDPVTQQAVYVGPAGETIEAGKHGTNKQTSKSLSTSGSGDGKTPQRSDDTVQTDYDTD
ncbi:putative ATP-grasp-modified RiPP [Nonomuraea mesophila]|uniref:Putative ATP-grasp-modified RiPP n=1 Tax=Nonomuraea mesophila TaxID=2530382 RepID=A0A4R5F1Q6_9ACTN|nr:putative ATP-grasp-modified RiPP [Nonomuraea mesophila]TDE41309.1 putative ATP-grasp-modified RiPP [Nonomuraea mesophila]